MERPASGFALTGATATAFALLVATVGVRSATTGNTGSSGSSVERVVVPTCRADVPPDSIKRAAELPACPDATALLNEFFGTTHPGETRPVAPLEVLVAILPDPIASHLDWAFDSSLEALRRAFERSGFVADRFWLPWMVHGDSARNRGQKLIALAEQRPGVMLFRRADPTKTDLRVVYIVGETPTSGVHKEALRRALDERRRLLGDAPLAVDSTTGKVIARGDTLKIIGPIFSGSVVSLQRATWSWAGEGTADRPRVVRLISGGATDIRNRHAMSCRSDAGNIDRCGKYGSVEFTATVNPQVRLEEAFRRRILLPLGIDTAEVALLREATTQYGRPGEADTLSASAQPLVIPFPMNISSLRAEYARSPDASLNNGPPINRTAQTRLDLRDPATSTENPPIMSDVSPAGLELVLDQMARDIVAHRIRIVGILATDVRDKIFLAIEMKKRIRDVQLFVYGSNILYMRPDFNEKLRGMYIVSTYPLFLENQWWGRSRTTGERLPFTSDVAEGTFNATVLQLGQEADLEEYGNPFAKSTTTTPPVWITTVGRTEFAPVIYDVSALDPWGSSGYLYGRKPTTLKRTNERGWTSGKLSFLVMLIVVGFVASFLLLQVHTAAQVRQDHERALAEREALVTLGAKDAERRGLERIVFRATLLLHREFYVLLRFAGLVGAFLPLFGIALRVRAHGQPIPPLSAWGIALIVFAGLFAVAVVTLALLQILHVLHIDRSYCYEFILRKHWQHKGELKRAMLWGLELVVRTAMLLGGLFYAAATIVLVLDVRALDAFDPVFFNRVAQGLSGVSPAVPIALGGIVFALWSTWHLARITVLSETTAFEEACMSSQVFLPSVPVRLRDDGDATPDAAFVLFRPTRRKATSAPATNASAAHPAGRSRVSASLARILRIDLLPAGASTRGETTHGGTQASTRTLSKPSPSASYAPGFDAPDPDSAPEGSGHATAHDQKPAASAGLAEDSTKSDEKSSRRPSLKDALLEEPRRLWRRVRVVFTLRARLARGFSLHGRDRTTPSVKESVRGIRGRLTLLIPDARGVCLAAIIVVAVMAKWNRFGRTTEAVVFPALLGGLSAYDWLFRICILGSIAATVWGVYRLSSVWAAFRTCLDAIGNSRLLDAFSRLPESVAQLTRLSPFDVPSHSVVDEIVKREWEVLQRIYKEDARKYTTQQRRHVSAVMSFSNDPPTISWNHHSNPALGDKFITLMKSVEELWKADPAGEGGPAPEGVPSATGEHAAASASSPAATLVASSADWKKHRRSDTPMRRWLYEAEVLAAVYVVEYVEWVLRNLRFLAMFLLMALITTTLMLSSYPFPAQNLVRLVYFFVFLLTIGSLMTMMVQMDRHRVLSHIAHTDDGRTNWTKGSLFANMALYGAAPIITLVGWEFPPVRDFLFSWVTPALHLITK